MATTTNYGWTTPDDTALVKDGASAIRTLGTSVDTTTKNLNPETTLGDISFRSSTSNVNTRLAIGGTGTVLTVAAGVPSWASVSAGGMTLLSTTNLSGTSTTISSISGAYNNLIVITNDPFFDVAAQLKINPNSTAGISEQSRVSNTTAGATTNILSIASPLLPTTSTPDNTFVLQISNYAQTTYGKNFSFSGDSGLSGSIFGGGVIKTTSAISSLQFTTGAGTSTFSGGQVLIYGVK